MCIWREVLEINDISAVKFSIPDTGNKKNAKPTENSVNEKSADANSLDALAMQGMAQLQINMHDFHDLKVKAISINDLISEAKENFVSNKESSLSDEEYETLKQEFYSKQQLLPDEIKEKTNNFDLNKSNIKIAIKLISDEKFFSNTDLMEEAEDIILWTVTEEQAEIAEKCLSDDKFLANKNFIKSISTIIYDGNNPENAAKDMELLSDKEINPSQIVCIIQKMADYDEVKKLNNIIGVENAEKLTVEDTAVAIKFPYLYNKQNVNEISIREKRDYLKQLLALNVNMFDISENMQEMFPILPNTQEKYCKLLPLIVHSLGITTEPLSGEEINNFNGNLNKLSATLSNMSDEDFKQLEFNQEYSKNAFINDVINKIKDLPDEEKQKVYDYYGFELHKNKNASYKTEDETGYSITGYPASLNNEEKLSLIENPDTKKVIENLRKNAVNFTKNNKVICSNKALETELNEIIKALPELRTSIGNIQAGMNNTYGSHQYDVFKHSLKVMQGIVKNPDYKNLNESDKKIMLLASLLHDITKTEGYIDKAHPDNSSFDAFFIAKKFKLNQEEEIKLYNLIKHHEWLGHVNRAETAEELDKELKSTAYDLRHDNMFDLSLIFTHADLKGVNDYFHDIKDEKRISKVDGLTRSYGEAADFHGEKIKEYIEELKKSQPLLPITQIPKASTIEQAITTVHSDGSTNIKGVYKDKDGLVIIKYNELQNDDLEKIGFPKGCKVKGIQSKTSTGEDVNTGNIKFFAHGLDFPNQLAKFDAFSLVDSDVLLSVSYAERP